MRTPPRGFYNMICYLGTDGMIVLKSNSDLGPCLKAGPTDHNSHSFQLLLGLPFPHAMDRPETVVAVEVRSQLTKGRLRHTT